MPRTQVDPDALADGVFRAVESFVERSLNAFTARLDALEARAPLPGDKGERGEKGEKGDPGSPGEKGDKGDQGSPGERGEKGEPGKDGAPGVTEKGDPGPEGSPGRDGRDGLPGRDGKDGLHGKDGATGLNGKDGLGFDDLTLEHDGERTVTLKFVQGDRVKEFPIVFPVVLDRGVYREEREYQRGDAVSFGGSLFIAQRPTKQKPETEDCGWRLSVKRGRDAKVSKLDGPK